MARVWMRPVLAAFAFGVGIGTPAAFQHRSAMKDVRAALRDMAQQLKDDRADRVSVDRLCFDVCCRRVADQTSLAVPAVPAVPAVQELTDDDHWEIYSWQTGQGR